MQASDGGPAFPVLAQDVFGNVRMVAPGLSLRDYFAAKVLGDLLGIRRDEAGAPCFFLDTARMSYAAADAMLAARAQAEQGTPDAAGKE